MYRFENSFFVFTELMVNMERTHLAGCIIVRPDSAVLLLHRNTKKRSQWEIPGGKVDPQEDPMRAAIREARLETGLEVEVVAEFGTQPFEQDSTLFIYSWYLAKVIAGTPEIRQPETHDEIRFISIDELRGISSDLSPNVKNFLGEIDSGRLIIPEGGAACGVPELRP